MWFSSSRLGPGPELSELFGEILHEVGGNKEFDRETYLTCFQLILNRCEPNVTGSFGRTPLHEVAAMRDHITEDKTGAFAEALLNAGAKVGGRDDLLKSAA